MFFNQKKSNIFAVFTTLLLVVILLLQSGCGGEGCRTAEEQILNGTIEKSQFEQVLPINKNVIQSSNQFGAFVLYDGTTEAMAKKNIWHELKTQNNNDLIVTSGNKFYLDASGSVMLAGTSQIINVQLKDYVKLNESIYSGSEVKEVKKNIKKQKPISMTRTVTYKVDGSYEYSYKFVVKDEQGAEVTVNSKNANIVASPGCAYSTIETEKINYIWYFPKKIVFHKWVDENYNLVDKVVTVDVENNDLSCQVQLANKVLWYVCTFTYNEQKLQYKRRVTPIIVENYPQFEEQVSKTDAEIAELLNGKTRRQDASGEIDISQCYDDDHIDTECVQRIIDQQQKEEEQTIQLTDEEYKQNYYMCILGGKTVNNQGFCKNYKFGIIGTEDEKITPKSPIMVVFKTYDEIYKTIGRSSFYDNQECFQQNEYKNRFLPISSATSCDDTERKSKYPQFCRMAPKNVSYNLHKIKKNGYDWLDHDASMKEILYCTTVCPKNNEYDLDNATGECPTDCAVRLYRDDGQSSNIDFDLYKPAVVSCVDYRHRRRKQADKRAGAQYDDANNTMYYALDENLIDNDGIDINIPNQMNWNQVRIPCINATVSSDSAGYRRVLTTSQPCCSDFTNTTKSEGGPEGEGYFMCNDVLHGKDCRTSLLTSTVCTSSMISQGNCYHIVTQNYTSDGAHSFCDGQQNDNPIKNDVQFIRATSFDPSKPAYFANMDAIRKYTDGTVIDIPKIYPGNDTSNVGLEYGLMPVASDDVVSIECTDEAFPDIKEFESDTIFIEKPENYDSMSDNAKTQFNIIPDSCEVSGTYSTYESDNNIIFNKGSDGIIPIQWLNFPVRAGDTVPINIVTKNPILIKSGEQYIEMRNGNGLMVYLEPNDDNDSSSTYVDPDMWQCNMGTGGSYGYYRPYDYWDRAVQSESRNPRKIRTPNEFWWFCDDEKPMWFSGYDFKNIKTGKPVYMHTYDTKTLAQFLPDATDVVPDQDKPVEVVGCNEDSLPTSMVIDGKLIPRTDITGIVYDASYGSQYVYIDGNRQRTIPVGDNSITNKTYEKYEPKVIVVDLLEEGLYDVQIQANTSKKTYNNLVRTYEKQGANIIQAYYEFDYFSKHYKIRIEDNVIHKPAMCYNEDTPKPSDTMSDEEVTKMTEINFTRDSKYYVLNESSNASEIFTRYGPFTGMHINTSGILLPAIYTTQGACLDHFIYDEQYEMMPWISIFGAEEKTKMLRKNLETPWRLEFTTPVVEYNNDADLIIEASDNSTGTLSSCYNRVNFESCGPTDTPDIVLIDLSETDNAKKKPISGSVVLYREENFIQYKDKYYYSVTFPPLNWVEYKLDKEDPRISSIKCGNYSNCDDEIPIIELTVNSVHYRIVDGDIIDGSAVKISKQQKQSTLSFDIIVGGKDYDAGNYTIDNPVLDENAICFTTNKICKSYLNQNIGIDKIIAWPSWFSKNEYLFSLSKAPYVVSCQANKNLKETTTSVYSRPYATSNDTFPTSISNGGYVLKTNLYEYIKNPYFARCVPSWITAKWMLMEQPNDPSTFYTGHSAVSGTYIAPDGQNWTINDIKDKYNLESFWKSNGGIVKNAIINQSCATKSLSSGATYKTKCTPTNTNVFNASFTAKYPKQIILVKPLVNDPINTSDDDCEITVTGSKTASATIQMNAPFGFKSSMINGYALDKKESESNIPGVQKNVTINGDGKHGGEFFKQSEFQRNMIGAGILTPPWSVLSSNNKTIIFDQNDQINFNASGNYYVAGALSNRSQGYCMILDSVQGVGAMALYALALAEELSSGVSLSAAIYTLKLAVSLGWPAGLSVLPEAAINFASFVASQAAALAAMLAGTEVAKAPMGTIQPEKNADTKRSCGIATAFRVVPIPPAACLSGYALKCNNERINEYVGGTDGAAVNEKMFIYCKSEESVDFRTKKMTIGACKKQIKDIKTKNVIETRPQRYKSSDAKYPNSLTDAIGKWSELENVYKENCGICVRQSSLHSYNGITYSIGEQPILPKTIRTDEHCKNYVDDDNEMYTWKTDIKIITPFDKYTFSNKNNVYNNIRRILTNKIFACEPGNEYSPSLSEEIVLNNIKTAFLNMQIRNIDSCKTSMISVYNYELASSDTTEECKNLISNDLDNMSEAACNDMLAVINNIDGAEYYNYIFSQNTASASCKDDKYNRTVGTNDNHFGSITRYDAESVLSEYGYGELTADESATTNDVTNITLHVPTTLHGKPFKTAKLGFFFAGEDNTDPLRLYKNYRIINQDDLKRGYIITVGNGLQATKGKYLYYYIQPLNDQGRPDPVYNPNTLLSLSSFVPEAIADNGLVYSFKEQDPDNTGHISVTSPRTGKLWVAILDGIKLSSGDQDTDGKYIIFNDTNTDGIMRVNSSNVLYTNSGYFTVQAKVQTDSEDVVDSATASETGNGLNKLLVAYIIKPIKQLFIGDYICKRCLIKDMSKCEENKDNIPENNWYTSEYKKICDYDWENGILGKIAASFLKIHLLYVAWFLLVIFSVFIIGFQFIIGEQKFDFKFMKQYLWRYALIMAFVNPQALELYLRLFVKPAFNLAEGLSAFVASNFSSEKYTSLDPQNFIDSAFGPIDKILKFWINKYTFEKLLAILFSSWTGIIVIIVLLMCFIFFMISVIEALILYIVILIKMSLYLAIGPIVFLLLIHEKTAGKFTEWWKTIAGCIAELVMMFAGLACFGTIYYYILKGSMNFIYCWEPVLKIPILDISLFSMWRIAGTMPAHMAELAGTLGEETSINTKGFNFLTAFMLFIISCMMSKFVDKASTFGAKIFGQSSSMPEEIKSVLTQAKKVVSGLPSQGINLAKNTIKNKISSERRSGAEGNK